MNIQGWFPLGLTGLVSLQSKGLSRVFSNTTVQGHQSFSAQPSLWSNFHIRTWLLEKPLLWLWTFVGNVMSLLFNFLNSFKFKWDLWSTPLSLFKEPYMWLNTLTFWSFWSFSKRLYSTPWAFYLCHTFRSNFFTLTFFAIWIDSKFTQSSSTRFCLIRLFSIYILFSSFTISSKKKQGSTFNILAGDLLGYSYLSNFIIQVLLAYSKPEKRIPLELNPSNFKIFFARKRSIPFKGSSD